MAATAHCSLAWASSHSIQKHQPSRGTIVRLLWAVFCVATGFFLVQSFLTFSHFLFPFSAKVAAGHPHDNAINHFVGSRECGIIHSDVYAVPRPSRSGISPFCKNRATLLEAMSSGGRPGFDEPYVGKGCTYKWFSTTEICMILERFNAISFIGDSTVQAIYAAFNMLLREDLALGGVQQWLMHDQERSTCMCDNQFLKDDCLDFAVKDFQEVKKHGRESPYICQRVPHAFIPVDTSPASAVAQEAFKALTYKHPTPWQPSPMIISFSHSLDATGTTRILDELATLAGGAERNIPMLFLGPEAAGLSKAGRDKNAAIWKFMEEISAPAKERHFEMLRLWNLTVQASMKEEQKYGEKVALVEALMVLNWLSMLETS